jgi:uncharacterized protein
MVLVGMFETCKNTLRRTGTVSFYVRVRPHASKTHVTAVMDDGCFRIDIAVPPECGKANRELIQFIAQKLLVQSPNVEIVMGEGSRHKSDQ